jgi:hypothetical protein
MNMQTVQLDISSDIFDRVMAFLEILPKNKIKLNVINNFSIPLTSSFNPRDFFGVANSSKSEIDDYLKQNRNEWDSYLDER